MSSQSFRLGERERGKYVSEGERASKRGCVCEGETEAGIKVEGERAREKKKERQRVLQARNLYRLTLNPNFPSEHLFHSPATCTLILLSEP